MNQGMLYIEREIERKGKEKRKDKKVISFGSEEASYKDS